MVSFPKFLQDLILFPGKTAQDFLCREVGFPIPIQDFEASPWVHWIHSPPSPTPHPCSGQMTYCKVYLYICYSKTTSLRSSFIVDKPNTQWMIIFFALGSLLLYDVALAVVELSGWE